MGEIHNGSTVRNSFRSECVCTKYFEFGSSCIVKFRSSARHFNIKSNSMREWYLGADPQVDKVPQFERFLTVILLLLCTKLYINTSTHFTLSFRDSRLTSLDHLKKLHLYWGSTSSRKRSVLPLSYPGPTGLLFRSYCREHNGSKRYKAETHLEQTKKVFPLLGPGFVTVNSLAGSPWTEHFGG